MKLNFQKADSHKTQEFFGIVKELNLDKLQMHSTKNQFMECFDRLPALFQWLQETVDVDDTLLQSLHADRDEIYSENHDHNSFHISMEFFWILERVSMAVMEKILIDEPQQISIISAEMFNIWQAKFTELPGIVPARNCPSMLSLGQSYSVSGFRRITQISSHTGQKISELSLGELDYNYKEFRTICETMIPMTSINNQENSWVFENFDEFQDQCREILGVIQDIYRSTENGQTLLAWLVDDELSSRAMENFVLDDLASEEVTD